MQQSHSMKDGGDGVQFINDVRRHRRKMSRYYRAVFGETTIHYIYTHTHSSLAISIVIVACKFVFGCRPTRTRKQPWIKGPVC